MDRYKYFWRHHATRKELFERMEWLEKERDRERSLRVYHDGVPLTQEKYDKIRSLFSTIIYWKERSLIKMVDSATWREASNALK